MSFSVFDQQTPRSLEKGDHKETHTTFTLDGKERETPSPFVALQLLDGVLERRVDVI